MNLQNYYQPVFDAIADSMPANPTFMEIAGFPHYENVCSNFLKYYLTPNDQLGNLDGVLMTAMLKATGNFLPPFSKLDNFFVKREINTNKGRIDLLLHNNDFVIAIENKIYHWLGNDLEEYAGFLNDKFGNRHVLKIVLSLKKESINDASGFINLTYANLISAVEAELSLVGVVPSNPHYIIFSQFIESIKNLDMPVQISDEEIQFLCDNQYKISKLTALNTKLASYINQRANKICQEVNAPHVIKSVYEGDEILMLYEHADLVFKIECILDPGGIYITICMKDGSLDFKALKQLQFFKERSLELFRINEIGDRMIIEENIDFKISDTALSGKLETLLLLLTICEGTHEQLN